MKRILFFLLLLMSFKIQAQFSGGTDTLRNFNNRFITNVATQAFTNLRLHNLLAGMIDWIDSARSGSGGIALGIDTVFAQNDSTLVYRKNGVFHPVIIRGRVNAGNIYEVPYSNGAGRFAHDSNFLFDKSQAADAARLIIGPTSVTDGGLSKINATSDNMNALALTSFGTGANTIIARRARGTVAAPTHLNSTDDLWNISGRGYTGTQFVTTGRASIYAQATQDWTDTTQGTKLFFRTTPLNSVTSTDRMTITDSIMLTPLIATTSDSIAAFRGLGTGLNTLIKIPALAIGMNIGNSSLKFNGDYSQNASNHQLKFDSIATGFHIYTTNVLGSTGTRKKSFKFDWSGTGFANLPDGWNLYSTIRSADNSTDSIINGIIASSSPSVQIGYTDLTTGKNTLIKSSGQIGLLDIIANDSIHIKGATASATADTIYAQGQNIGGTNKLLKIPVSGLSYTPTASTYSVLGNVTSSTAPVTSLHYSVYNVLDFGLVADSVTDNTTALRALLTIIPQGASLYFPGTGKGYYFADSIVISSSLNIYGDGKAHYKFFTVDNKPNRGATNLFFGSNSKNFLIIKASATNLNPVITMHDLTIFGNDTTSNKASGSAILFADNIGGSTIYNVTIGYFYTDVKVRSGNFLTFENCSFIAPWKYAIDLGNTGQVDLGVFKFYNCNIFSGYHNSGDSLIGLIFRGGGYVDISNCHFNAEGVYNYVTQFKYDLYTTFEQGQTSDFFITNCLFENYKTNGVRLRNTSGTQIYSIHLLNNLLSPFNNANQAAEAIDIQGNFIEMSLTANGGHSLQSSPSISPSSFMKLDSCSGTRILPGNQEGWTDYMTITHQSDISETVMNPTNFNANTTKEFLINNLNTGSLALPALHLQTPTSDGYMYMTNSSYPFGASALTLRPIGSAHVELWSASGSALTVFNGGNVAVNSTTDAGQNFQVNGTSYVSGNATFGTTCSIVGTATNNSATAGNIGETVESYTTSYTNYTTSATYQAVDSITLTAGDWNIDAQATFSTNSATITGSADAIFVISTTRASASGALEGKNIAYISEANLLGTSHESITIASYRVSISGTTKYYLNSQSTFTIGNPQIVGGLHGRRSR